MPQVASVMRKDLVVSEFRRQTGDSMGTFSLVLTLFAVTIAVSVVYNNARVALSMRRASLRACACSASRAARSPPMLIGELAVQVLLGIPFGLLFGKHARARHARANDPEAFRFPPFISHHTYAFAALVTVIVGVAERAAGASQARQARLDRSAEDSRVTMERRKRRTHRHTRDRGRRAAWQRQLIALGLRAEADPGSVWARCDERPLEVTVDESGKTRVRVALRGVGTGARTASRASRSRLGDVVERRQVLAEISPMALGACSTTARATKRARASMVAQANIERTKACIKRAAGSARHSPKTRPRAARAARKPGHDPAERSIRPSTPSALPRRTRGAQFRRARRHSTSLPLRARPPSPPCRAARAGAPLVADGADQRTRAARVSGERGRGAAGHAAWSRSAIRGRSRSWSTCSPPRP